MAMSDRSTNQVMSRRLGALSIDVGTVVSITALAAWAKAEKFIPDQVESGSQLPTWSTVDQARRNEIAQDSWNRMQKVGNTEYVWTRDSLLTVGLVGIGAAALVFLLIPAVIRSTIGKKIFRIRSKKKSSDTDIDGGQLDRRTSGDDSETNIIDLNDRLSETNAGASAIPVSTEDASTKSDHLAQADELIPNEFDIDLGDQQVRSTEDLLPIDVLPLDAAPGVSASEPFTNFTAGTTIPLDDHPLDHHPLDVEAGGLLGMEVSEDLPTLWPKQPIDLGATTTGDATLPDQVANADTSLESVPESVVENPNAELPDLGIREPVHSTLSEPAITSGDDEESQPLPPPPLHRAVKWDPPTAEPAPVWSPETDQSAEAEQLVDADLNEFTISDSLSDDSTEADQSFASNTPPQATEVDDEPSASTTPSWNEDWQAWIYWDQAHGQWIRHDVEANVWIPLS